MSNNIKVPCRYDFVGSFLRPDYLKKARADFENGTITAEQLKEVEDKAILDLVAKQKKAGYHIITDGEFRRATWHLDFMWGFNGVGHSKTQTGLPFHGEAAMIDDTYLTGKVSVGDHPFVEHFKFVKALEDENTVAKQTIPAPAQFLEQMIMPFALENTKKYYNDTEELVQDIAKELPAPPVQSYFLCDCWYVSEKIINTFAVQGFHTIGALKTNRLLYPSGMKKKLSELAAELSVTHKNFDLVTVKGKNYYVYRYESNLNGIENAIVLFSYPEKAFGKPKALRTFLCMDVSLSTNEILDNYVCRWPIEVFFRQCKDKLALDSYQIRSAQGIRRYWLIMSFAHYMCVVGTGKVCPFETGYRRISDIIQMEKYLTLYQCARECIGFDSFVKVVA